HDILSEILRTPIAAFINLLDYPFQPNYIDLLNPGSIGDGKTKLRLHYLDEGNKSSPETILLLHGEPSWSYLYRHLIPKLKKYRVITVDLIGFGKSDKPANKNDYTSQRHVNWIREFIENLNLNNITLFCQVKFGYGKISKGFIQCLDFASQQTEMDVGRVIKSGVVRDMKQEEIDAYNTPFSNEQYQYITINEDKPHEIVEHLIKFIKDNPLILARLQPQ
ncbi:unnamed protein product, partial [Adineta steineri]